MTRLLRADFYHVFCKKWLWMCVLFMMCSAVFFCMMQYTAMDYIVAMDRVIFLPMSFYGVAVAGFITIVVGEDFSDGIIRNKLISGKSKIAVYFSLLIVSSAACVIVYAITVLTSYGIGVHFFENNVSGKELLYFFCMGLGISLVFAGLFCTITTLCGNKGFAAVICMILAFVMLFLAMHFNGILVQQEYKDGVLNPHYVGGIKRSIYEWIHDINPFGQAAQLSQMKCDNPIRCMIADILMIMLTGMIGMVSFHKKDIN